MSQRKGPIIAVLVLAFLLIAGVGAYRALAPQATSSNYAGSSDGSRIADFSVADADGNEIPLSVIADGKPAIVNFWATWCPYCIQEMDDFQKLYEKYGSQVSFVMLDAVDGTRETVEDGKSFIAGKGYTFPVYYDTMRSGVRELQVTGYPTTVVLAPDGAILDQSSGRIDPDKVDAFLKGII